MTIEKIYWWIMVVRMIFIIPKKFYGQVTIECDGNVSPMAFEDDKITIEPLDAFVMTEIQKYSNIKYTCCIRAIRKV